MRAYLESNQRSRQTPAAHERFLQAKVPEVYFDKSHMDSYHFRQQYKDHFKTAGAIRTNRTPFAAFFFRGNISVCWTQYKQRHRGEELTPIT